MPVHDWRRVDAGIFHHFHHEWISTISRTLNAGLLPPEYYALAEPIAGGFHPDVLALAGPDPTDQGSKRGNGKSRPDNDQGGIALADAPPKVRFTFKSEMTQYAAKRKRIVIRHRSGDEVIALVEIVSPGNKASAGELSAFVAKAKNFLNAKIHLLLLDLFPPCRRDPQGIHGALWDELGEPDDEFHLPKRKPLTLASYQAGDVVTAYVETVAVDDELPDMPLFFHPSRYVLVPLETTYQAAFEAVPKRWRVELEPSSS